MCNGFVFRNLFNEEAFEFVDVISPGKGFCVSRKKAEWLGIPDDYELAIVVCEHLGQLGLVGLEFPLKSNGHTAIRKVKVMFMPFKLQTACSQAFPQLCRGSLSKKHLRRQTKLLQ